MFLVIQAWCYCFRASEKIWFQLSDFLALICHKIIYLIKIFNVGIYNKEILRKKPTVIN